MKKTSRIAAIYARVSTKDQNCEMQLRELREYAAFRGFEIYREYVDNGVTGNVRKRESNKVAAPGYEELIRDSKRHRFNAVLVWRFDRLARSLSALAEVMELFRELGIEFVSKTEQIDTTLPGGRLVFAVFAAFAEFEREVSNERITAGLDNARAKGVKLGRPIDLAVDRMVADLRERGYGVRAIARAVGRSPAGIARIIERFKTNPPVYTVISRRKKTTSKD